ncbi:MAG: uroporphyrinogen-III synthase, partial [Thiothrix sp.]|nr:uroporphyrinogen-III synthase [Thiothrix sp.]
MAGGALPLASLQVVVTRPAEQAHGMCTLLENAGARVFRLPLLAVEPVLSGTDSHAVKPVFEDYNAVIFVSTNAVIHAGELLSFLQSGAARRSGNGGPEIGAIGSRTAQQLAQAGIPVSWVPEQGFTSEDFLALPALQSLPHRHILIVRGQGGRGLLRTVLQQRGAVVDYREVYRRCCPPIDMNQLMQHHQKEPFDMLMLTSGESL